MIGRLSSGLIAVGLSGLVLLGTARAQPSDRVAIDAGLAETVSSADAMSRSAGADRLDAELVWKALAIELDDAPELGVLYTNNAPLWPDGALDAFLQNAVADGLAPELAALPRGDDADAVAARDVATTRALLALAERWSGTRADPAELYPDRWFAPRRRAGVSALLRRAAAADRPAEAVQAELAALHPPHAEYRRLRQRARQIRRAVAQATRQPFPAAAPRTLGAAAAIPAPPALPYVDEAHLLGQIELNLERWRWLPAELGARHVWVNIPAFDLAVRQGAHGRYRDRLRMPATVGQTDAHWQTPVLSDRIVAASFFPTWTPTVTIQREEILPQARLDGGAELDSLGFFVERRGRRLSPRDVDWERTRAGQVRIVQRGGPLGRLGRIKFVMPNDQYILIHDTTTPGEFDAETRAFSHGCVRAGDVEALADEILGLANGWEAGRASGMLQGAPRSRSVGLRERLPVHLVYLTAEVTEAGELVLHDDLYGFDAPLARALAYSPPSSDR